LNVLLGGVCLFCLAIIVQQLVWSPAPPAGRPRRATPPRGPALPVPAPPHPPVSAYHVIANRNVLSPTRSDPPTAATTAGPLLGRRRAGPACPASPVCPDSCRCQALRSRR